eukprot:TRINITY_DN9309_c0_g4_i1.p1 TRINITY_DN9309_c0_g4~~TRINITY_DN9309_c0_g4_i1.p1  ORF type:complete len:401 (+),score=95.90 TRINITY_DN9309_c0_g4_i1:99-1205(+)
MSVGGDIFSHEDQALDCTFEPVLSPGQGGDSLQTEARKLTGAELDIDQERWRSLGKAFNTPVDKVGSFLYVAGTREERERAWYIAELLSSFDEKAVGAWRPRDDVSLHEVPAGKESNLTEKALADVEAGSSTFIVSSKEGRHLLVCSSDRISREKAILDLQQKQEESPASKWESNNSWGSSNEGQRWGESSGSSDWKSSGWGEKKDWSNTGDDKSWGGGGKENWERGGGKENWEQQDKSWNNNDWDKSRGSWSSSSWSNGSGGDQQDHAASQQQPMQQQQMQQPIEQQPMQQQYQQPVRADPLAALQQLRSVGRYPQVIDDWANYQEHIFGGFPPLPPGWIRVWSNSRSSEYYVRLADGSSSLDPPVG